MKTPVVIEGPELQKPLKSPTKVTQSYYKNYRQGLYSDHTVA